MAQDINIKDGSSGNIAKVDTNKRVHTAGIALTQLEASALAEGYYNWNTGVINLTSSDSASGIIYLKNTSDDNLVIKLHLMLMGESTGGAGDCLVQTYKNIGDASTLVSGALAMDMDGVNFHTSGADKPSTITSYKGVEGATLVGGTKTVATLKQNGAPEARILTNILIGKNENIAIYVTTQVGNTSMNVMGVLSGYYETDNVAIK